MNWITRVSGVISLAMATIVLSPSLQSLPQTEAIRSSSTPTPPQQPFPPISVPPSSSSFRTSPTFLNSPDCPSSSSSSSLCHPSTVHVAITLDSSYLRGSIAAVHSVLHHSNCPHSLFFHFLVDSDSTLHSLVRSTFPHLLFKLYYFDPFLVRPLISTSVRHALEHPLNYARNYLADLLEPCVRRVIYLDSDLVLVDDISKLWFTDLHGLTIGAPQYCHANFTNYFSPSFWNHPRYSGVFSRRNPCYFNTGVMVMDLVRWRRGGYTARIEKWMQIQKAERIYELGSLPPFLLVFAGHVASIDHRWNQHGLGGDNVKGSCRDLHAGPVSLLHWSGSGKPWIRLDSRRPCPLDYLWSPYDLFGQRR